MVVERLRMDSQASNDRGRGSVSSRILMRMLLPYVPDRNFCQAFWSFKLGLKRQQSTLTLSYLRFTFIVCISDESRGI